LEEEKQRYEEEKRRYEEELAQQSTVEPTIEPVTLQQPTQNITQQQGKMTKLQEMRMKEAEEHKKKLEEEKKAALLSVPPGTQAPTVSPVSSSASDWSKATAPDGRTYYYNKATKQTSWKDPNGPTEEPKESADDWKEAVAKDGRKYYYNRVTKETSWKIPEIMKKKLEDPGQSSAPVTTETSGETPLPTDWREATAPDGRKYYHNIKTKATSWKRPE